MLGKIKKFLKSKSTVIQYFCDREFGRLRTWLLFKSKKNLKLEKQIINYFVKTFIASQDWILAEG